jgi:general secretion pathway protein E
MQVHGQIDLGFAAGVRTLMRQDPDIIMVGEIRDLETAEMAIQAALTGHLVLSTLHTNDAPSAVVRLMDIGLPPYLINATLLGVIGQRLVRCLCPECRKAGETDPGTGMTWCSPGSCRSRRRTWRPIGCERCRGSGYFGRMGIYESLRVTTELRQTIRPDCDIADIRRQAVRDGMEPLRIGGARKIIGGITSVDEVMRVAPLVELG